MPLLECKAVSISNNVLSEVCKPLFVNHLQKIKGLNLLPKWRRRRLRDDQFVSGRYISQLWQSGFPLFAARAFPL